MRLRFFNRKISRLLLLAMSLAMLGTLFFPAVASAHVLGNGKLTGFYTGQFDAPTLFNLVMISLVEVGAVFWVGAQLWLNFVLQTSSEKHAVERGINEQVQARLGQGVVSRIPAGAGHERAFRCLLVDRRGRYHSGTRDCPLPAPQPAAPAP